jgi:hypothetical protein
LTSISPHKLVLDTSTSEPWEINVCLDVLLAYPTAKPDRVTRLISAICSEQIAATIEQFPDRRDELLEKYPDYDPRIRVGYSALIPRIEDALLVGAVILPLIQETATGQAPRLPQSISQPSVDQLIRHLWPRRGRESELTYDHRVHDFEKRKYRPRFPVAHLCAASQMIAQQRAERGATATYNYQDLSFARERVTKAKVIAEHIKATPELKLMASRLIQIDWIEPEQISAPV